MICFHRVCFFLCLFTSVELHIEFLKLLHPEYRNPFLKRPEFVITNNVELQCGFVFRIHLLFKQAEEKLRA